MSTKEQTRATAELDRLLEVAFARERCPTCSGKKERHAGLIPDPCLTCDGSGEGDFILGDEVRVECAGHWVVVEDHRANRNFPKGWGPELFKRGAYLGPYMADVPNGVTAIQEHGDWCCHGQGSTPSRNVEDWWEILACLEFEARPRRRYGRWDITLYAESHTIPWGDGGVGDTLLEALVATVVKVLNV